MRKPFVIRYKTTPEGYRRVRRFSDRWREPIAMRRSRRYAAELRAKDPNHDRELARGL